MNFLNCCDNIKTNILFPIDRKELYKDSRFVLDYSSFDKDSFLESIKFLNKLDIPKVNVLGGESFFNFDLLKEIEGYLDKKITIVTTFPKVSNIYEIIEFINKSKKINEVQIIRNNESFDKDKKFFSYDILEDFFIQKINKKIKIKTLVSNDINVLEILDRWSSFNYLELLFFTNYLNPDDFLIDSKYDKFFNDLLYFCSYIEHSSSNINFSLKCKFEDININLLKEKRLTSSILSKDYTFVDDLIVLPNGAICYDWDGKDNYIDSLFFKLRKKNNDEKIKDDENRDSRMLPFWY